MSILIPSLKQSLSTFIRLCKIMIPVIILLKLQEPFGLLDNVSEFLQQIMHIVGLPGYAGIVWATAMFTNLYTALIVLATLWQEQPLSTAEVSVLSLMMLIAHNLAIEITIAHKGGINALFSLVWRIGCAYLAGWLAFQVLDLFAWLDAPANMLLEIDPTVVNQGWSHWLWSQLETFFLILIIITALTISINWLKHINGERYLQHLFRPFLRMFRLSDQLTYSVLIGMSIGIAYGAGLLISEMESNKISRQEGCKIFSIFNLNHALIEDSILMLLAGASLWIVLLFRLIVGLFLSWVFCRLLESVPLIARLTTTTR